MCPRWAQMHCLQAVLMKACSDCTEMLCPQESSKSLCCMSAFLVTACPCRRIGSCFQ